MKWKTLIGIAVASAFASAVASTGALAGPFNHGTEVQTPMSVNESAPWLALEESGYTMPSRIHQDEVPISDSALGTGAISTESASGVSGFDSSVGGSSETVDYWRLDESSDAGSTTGFGSGSGSFSSSVSSSSMDESIQLGSVTTYYGDNLALLLDTGIDSGEMEA
jgi:hypothetical protein